MPLTITEEMMKQDPFFQEGLEKGSQRERQRVVISLYKKGKSLEEIAELLDLTIEEVKKFLEKRTS